MPTNAEGLNNLFEFLFLFDALIFVGCTIATTYVLKSKKLLRTIQNNTSKINFEYTPEMKAHDDHVDEIRSTHKFTPAYERIRTAMIMDEGDTFKFSELMQGGKQYL